MPIALPHMSAAIRESAGAPYTRGLAGRTVHQWVDYFASLVAIAAGMALFVLSRSRAARSTIGRRR